MTLSRLVAADIVNFKTCTATLGLAYQTNKLAFWSRAVAKQKTDGFHPTPIVVEPPDAAEPEITELFNFGCCTHAHSVDGIAARINQLMVKDWTRDGDSAAC